MAKRKYLVVGTGGVGGSIASFMSLGGKDVTCIARGSHLQKINVEGIHLKSFLKGDMYVPVKAFSAENFDGKADVIFVCVKGYSLFTVTDVIKRASTPQTVIIPVLNVFGTGEKLASAIPDAQTLAGCIYIIGTKTADGEITQQGEIFRVVFGNMPGGTASSETLASIAEDLKECGIEARVSSDIMRDTFCKWAFISAMACTGAYYDVAMSEVQHNETVRITFVNLLKEAEATGRKSGINIPANFLSTHIKVMDNLDPTSTASMQKDLKRGHNSEINELLFDMLQRGEKLGLEMPTYKTVAKKFQEYKKP